MSQQEFPVHSNVQIHEANTIYRSDDWWKAAVRHSYGSAESGELAIAIYLWHRDEDWSRKNKYRVRTTEAWQSDKLLIEQYLSGDGQPISSQDVFPVSDYYRVSQGETVFQTDEWWKAILLVDQKGSYETEEVILYLWQQVDGDWRRRQKYAIKDVDDWKDDRDAVDDLIEAGESEEIERVHSADRVEGTESAPDAGREASTPTGNDGLLKEVQSEFKELHLGDEA